MYTIHKLNVLRIYIYIYICMYICRRSGTAGGYGIILLVLYSEEAINILVSINRTIILQLLLGQL